MTTKLIIGIGNPDEQYQNTRHNVGFMLVDYIAKKNDFSAQGGPASGWKITPENFAEFITMINNDEISSKVAKMVLAEMFNMGGDPSQIVEANNWGQMKDDGQLEKVIQEVIAKNPKAVADYKAGQKNAIQFLSGQVMAATRGTANPASVQEILKEIL